MTWFFELLTNCVEFKLFLNCAEYLLILTLFLGATWRNHWVSHSRAKTTFQAIKISVRKLWWSYRAWPFTWEEGCFCLGGDKHFHYSCSYFSSPEINIKKKKESFLTHLQEQFLNCVWFFPFCINRKSEVLDFALSLFLTLFA